MQKIINIDWVSMRVVLPLLAFDQIESHRYRINKAEHGTQQFRDLYHIIDARTNEEVASLASNARAEMFMPPEQGILKLENKYLYQVDLLTFIKNLLAYTGLSFMNYVRLDFACDFLTFKNFTPDEFITGFAEARYLKMKRTSCSLFGLSPTIDDDGNLQKNRETLSFGKYNSKVTYKLYNKTAEMAAKKHKQWIADAWAQAGWDGSQKVWRLEFQYSNDRLGYRISEDELMFFSDINIIEKWREMWLYGMQHLFTFAHAERTKGGKWKKQSRCKPVEFFDDDNFQTAKFKPDSKKLSGRRQKILSKNLETLYQDLRGNHEHLALAGNMMLTYIISVYGLEQWQAKKLPDFVPDRGTIEYLLSEKVVRHAFGQLADAV